ncbi:Retrotransposon-derived protein peg10, partial [Mortierella sp. NVP41]
RCTPLVTLTAALRSIVTGNQESRRIHQENQRAQEAYQAGISNILNQLSARPTPSTSIGRLPIPMPFTDKDKFKGAEGDLSFMVFKAQLQAQMSKFPHTFTTDTDRITYAFQCMTGSPAQYFAMLYNGQLSDTQGVMSNYNLFLETTDRMFGDQHNREECEHKLARLRQANGPFHDYLIRFRELSSRTEWNDAALLARFKDGLSFEIKHALASQWSKFSTMEEAIAATNLAAQNLKTRELFTRRGQQHQQHQPTPRHQQTVMVSFAPSGPSPMDLDYVSECHSGY